MIANNWFQSRQDARHIWTTPDGKRTRLTIFWSIKDMEMDGEIVLRTVALVTT